MKAGEEKALAWIFAAALCAGSGVPARAFWTEEEKPPSALDQLGLAADIENRFGTSGTLEDNVRFLAAQSGDLPCKAVPAEAGKEGLAARVDIGLTALERERLLVLARYVYEKGGVGHALTLSHTFSTHELAAEGVAADGGFRLTSLRFMKHDGFSDNSGRDFRYEFTMGPDFTLDPLVTIRHYYTKTVETRHLDSGLRAILSSEIARWLDEGGRWVRYPSAQDLRLREIEKRAIELEKRRQQYVPR